MKSMAKQSIYFSAYPLKVVEKAAVAGESSHQSPYLRALLSGQAKTFSRIRVSPMADPYRNKSVALPLRPSKPSEEVKPEGKDWFNHYE